MEGASVELFMALYKELYYRHMYARLQPALMDRLHSYINYCNLFSYLLKPASTTPPSDASATATDKSTSGGAAKDASTGGAVGGVGGVGVGVVCVGVLDLPEHWLWDMLDEFIYQFQQFCLYRCKGLLSRGEDELDVLKENPNIWNVHSVLNVLHSFIDKSHTYEQLDAYTRGLLLASHFSVEFGFSLHT